MQTRVDHEILLGLLDRSGLDDRSLERLLGVHQTTLWRLRNGKIAKVSRYIETLRRHVVVPSRDADTALVENLVAVSGRSPALRAMLLALQSFMQEPA